MKDIQLFIRFKDNDYCNVFDNLRHYSTKFVEHIKNKPQLNETVLMLASIIYVERGIDENIIKNKDECSSSFNDIYNYFKQNVDIYVGREACIMVEKEFSIQNKESLYINITTNNNKIIYESFTLI